MVLEKVDFSNNLLRRLTDKIFSGLQSTLLELKLSDNLFGDALNPVFSTTEFHGLTKLGTLDLSGNQIRALEEGILKGCENLKVNTLVIIPLYPACLCESANLI